MARNLQHFSKGSLIFLTLIFAIAHHILVMLHKEQVIFGIRA